MEHKSPHLSSTDRMESSVTGAEVDAPVGQGESPVRSQRERELRDFIVNTLLPSGYEQVDLDTPLLEWGVIDSILIQGLLSFMEDRYGVMIPPENVKPEHFGTVRQMAAVVEQCKQSDLQAHGGDAFEILNRLQESYGLERRWIDLPTGRHHVLRCPGRKPTLVLLSGLGSPASSWGLLMRSLNGKREVIAVDLAGFGVSDDGQNADYSFLSHVRNTLGIIEDQAASPCVLVGNSAGGMIAAEIARQRPDLCAAMIVISFGRVCDGKLWWRQLEELSKDPCAFWKRAFFDPPPLDRALRAQLEKTLSSRAYQEFLDPDTMGGMDGVFAGLHLPTMFLGGMNDGIIEPAIVEAGAAQVPGARLEWIARCGHYPQSERSEEVLVYIEHFLKQHSLGGDRGAANSKA